MNSSTRPSGPHPLPPAESRRASPPDEEDRPPKCARRTIREATISPDEITAVVSVAAQPPEGTSVLWSEPTTSTGFELPPQLCLYLSVERRVKCGPAAPSHLFRDHSSEGDPPETSLNKFFDKEEVFVSFEEPERPSSAGGGSASRPPQPLHPFFLWARRHWERIRGSVNGSRFELVPNQTPDGEVPPPHLTLFCSEARLSRRRNADKMTQERLEALCEMATRDNSSGGRSAITTSKSTQNVFGRKRVDDVEVGVGDVEAEATVLGGDLAVPRSPAEKSPAENKILDETRPCFQPEFDFAAGPEFCVLSRGALAPRAPLILTYPLTEKNREELRQVCETKLRLRPPSLPHVTMGALVLDGGVTLGRGEKENAVESVRQRIIERYGRQLSGWIPEDVLSIAEVEE